MEKHASNHFPIHEILKSRWSSRAFSSRAVDLQQLLSIFEAARWAPSGGNLQPWFFVFTDNLEDAEHALFSQILSEHNAVWAKQAPVIVLAVAKMDRAEGQPNPWALYDLGQAVANLIFQATALGFATHQIGGFDKQKAREKLNIPAGYEPVTMITIGYQGDLTLLPADLQQREQQARTRKPVQEFVFHGSWDQPIPFAEGEKSGV
jgi:nitroreductase